MWNIVVTWRTSGIFVHKVTQSPLLSLSTSLSHHVILKVTLPLLDVPWPLYSPPCFVHKVTGPLSLHWPSFLRNLPSTYSSLPSLCLPFLLSVSSILSIISLYLYSFLPPLSPSPFSLLFLPLFSLPFRPPFSLLLFLPLFLYSFSPTSTDHEIVSIFGEKNGLVLGVDRNTWVVYITVVPLGALEKWGLRWVTSVAGCWPILQFASV